MRKAIIVLLFCVGFLVKQSAIAQKNRFKNVPGTVVCHQGASSGKYIGSPSLAILPNGDYVASHDFFGPNSSEWQQAETVIYRSKDKGLSWKKLSVINGAFWSTIFVHRDTLYLLGPDRHHGTVLIRKSADGGKHWTTPQRNNGLLLLGQFHCAPMPVIEHNGRLWRPMETAHGPDLAWGKRYGAMMMSASVNSDLMKPKSWKTSNVLFYDSLYLNANFMGWLEGNFVVDKEKRMWNMLRVHNKDKIAGDSVAFVSIDKDGKKIAFDPKSGFAPFDGGSKKFVVKYDTVSGKYWTLANTLPEKYRQLYPNRNPFSFRNVLTLKKSDDLIHWQDVSVVLEHPDVIKHGFQYVDWRIEDNDIIFLSRTAYFDGKEDAHNNHDANFLTFHRIANFRQL